MSKRKSQTDPNSPSLTWRPEQTPRVYHNCTFNITIENSFNSTSNVTNNPAPSKVMKTMYDFFERRNEPVEAVSASSETIAPPSTFRKQSSDSVKFNKSKASHTSQAKSDHNIMFADVVTSGLDMLTSQVFEYHKRNTPLAHKDCSIRGYIAEEVVKRALSLQGKTIVTAEKSLCVNGVQRGNGMESYDFGVQNSSGTRRFEVKNARMSYAPSMERWQLNFQGIKPNEFDELILCFEGFDGLRLYKWCGTMLSRNGTLQDSTGFNVIVSSSKHEPDSTIAHSRIVSKLVETGNTFIAFIDYYDPVYKDLWNISTKSQSVYNDVPLGSLSSAARGSVIEGIVRNVVRNVLQHECSDAEKTKRVNGDSRGMYDTAYDFTDGDKKAEVKSCLMTWDKSRRGYSIIFKNIKRNNFDILYLAWMTPKGIHIFVHDGKSGLTDTGKSTSSRGNSIKFQSPRGRKGYQLWSASESYLLRRFRSVNLPYIAFVEFAPGDCQLVTQHAYTL